jgi:hypothetical protein
MNGWSQMNEYQCSQEIYRAFMLTLMDDCNVFDAIGCDHAYGQMIGDNGEELQDLCARNSGIFLSLSSPLR